jgi:hypothetical protein
MEPIWTLLAVALVFAGIAAWIEHIRNKRSEWEKQQLDRATRMASAADQAAIKINNKGKL